MCKTLSFAKESRKLAQALGDEHLVLGELIEDIDKAQIRTLTPNLLEQARSCHEAVRFQRARTDAARGQVK